MRIFVASIIASLSAGAAFAGNPSAVISDPVPMPMAAPTYEDISWTGAYAGLQYGQGDGEASFGGNSVSTDGDAFGVHAGYLHDMGQFVLGGELSYDRISADDIDGDSDLLRLRGRAGYDLGRFMPYITAGFARVSDDDFSETGLTYGIGAEYLVTDQFGIGVEYSRSNFSDVDGIAGLDLDVDMIQLRTSYHF